MSAGVSLLGTSGLRVSVISYGNWVTQCEGPADQARAWVDAALLSGITTFDTADPYGNGGAETILGDALAGHAARAYKIEWRLAIK
jgi:aryl-alcohol dehydrogenase-like predicted oxidoreductase